MKNICVIGYYDHNNLGDEQYKLTFGYIIKKYLSDYTCNFIDCDNLLNTNFIDTDIILVGGGDILNDYFIDKIIQKFQAKPNKIIAVSVGIPYTSILNANKLSILDYIFIRTKQDIDILSSHFNPERIMYLPDISYFLNSMTTPKPSIIENLRLIQERTEIIIPNKGCKIITLCLSQHIYNVDYISNYNDILSNLSKFVIDLITKNYHIVFLPFNTNAISIDENDIIINTNLLNLIKMNHTNVDYSKYITFIDKTISAFDTNAILSISYIVIPMRFHACLLSIYNNIPILPIFTTRKVKNLLLDINWLDSYQLEINDHDIPISLDSKILIDKMTSLEAHYAERVALLNVKNTFLFGKEITDTIAKVVNTITIPYDKIGDDKHKRVVHFKSNNDIIDDVYTKVLNIIHFKGYTSLDLVKDKKDKNLLVSIVSYNLAGKNINSIYNYGLLEKMFKVNYNYQEEWKWILNDFKNNYKPRTIESNTNGLFNINYLDQIDYSGIHRSGWQYVYENISYLHDDNHLLLLDMYLDRTFIWNSEINEILDFIPYKKSWIGFIHHTFDTSFSKNNCYTLFENPLFLESLKCCKGLFVLSKYLQKQIQDYCIKKRIHGVKVFNIMHPTETNVPTFNLKKFLNNDYKKMLHIGGWLRDAYSFFHLDLPNIK
jgi:polysaccharide pyruvyl transferase WcaK-like protein